MEGRSKKCHELNQLEVTIGIAYSINGDGLTVLGDPRITEWLGREEYSCKRESPKNNDN